MNHSNSGERCRGTHPDPSKFVEHLSRTLTEVASQTAEAAAEADIGEAVVPVVAARVAPPDAGIAPLDAVDFERRRSSAPTVVEGRQLGAREALK